MFFKYSVKRLIGAFLAVLDLIFTPVTLLPIALVTGLSYWVVEEKGLLNPYMNFLLFVLVSSYAAIPLARLLARAVPPNEKGIPPLWMSSVLLCYMIFMLSGYGFDYATSFLSDWDVEPWQEAFAMGFVILSAALPIMTALRYIAIRRQLQRPLVLYLRSFSISHADQSLARAVIRSLHRDCTLLFLVSPVERPGNHEFFLSAFSGWKWSSPISSAPVAIRTKKKDWLELVKDWINSSSLLIAETSLPTGGLSIELKAVMEQKQTQKLVLLRDLTSKKGKYIDHPDYFDAQYVTYTTSWLWALPRIILQFIWICITSYILYWLLYGITSTLVMWIMVAGYGAYALALILQPSIPPGSRKRIQDAINNEDKLHL